MVCLQVVDDPVEDQWTYHAVADVILGHSLLRSFPEVDPDRIGLTGISWGGYLACIVSAVDGRFPFTAPVYGCGFLGEDSTWLGTFEKMGKEKAAKWLSLWDPSRYLPGTRMPMLWLNGTNDFAYPLGSYQKSYRLPRGERTLVIRVRMRHAHGGPGERPEEIRAFADALFRGGPPMTRITGQGVGPYVGGLRLPGPGRQGGAQLHEGLRQVAEAPLGDRSGGAFTRPRRGGGPGGGHGVLPQCGGRAWTRGERRAQRALKGPEGAVGCAGGTAGKRWSPGASAYNARGPGKRRGIPAGVRS